MKISSIFKESSDRQLKGHLRANPGLFLFKYSGANSADLTKLRRDLKNTGARMFVTKNSFINLNLKGIDNNNIGKEVVNFINGPTALIFINDDPVSPCKILVDFAKIHEAVEFKGGFLRDRIIQPQEFKMIANIPPKAVLYQQIAVAFNGPVSKLATSLNQIMAKLAYALNAVSEKIKKGN